MWSGSFVAIVTPFDARGRIDKRVLEQFVDWQIQEGTEGIVCCGSTGEGITLSEKEREKVLSICLAVSAGRVPLIVGTGTADTRQSVRMTERMLKLGAQGCLIPSPPYNKPTQKGLFLHVAEIAKVGLPVIVYNNPGRGMKFELETVVEIAKLKGVIAYKDSTADIDFIRRLKRDASIPIFSGDDHMTYQTLKEGGTGAISVIGNLFPRKWKEMIHLALCGQLEAAKTISDRLASVYEVLFLETNPQCVKYGVSLLGKCKEFLRLPLLPPSSEVQARVRQAVEEYQNSTG